MLRPESSEVSHVRHRCVDSKEQSYLLTLASLSALGLTVAWATAVLHLPPAGSSQDQGRLTTYAETLVPRYVTRHQEVLSI